MGPVEKYNEILNFFRHQEYMGMTGRGRRRGATNENVLRVPVAYATPGGYFHSNPFSKL